MRNLFPIAASLGLTVIWSALLVSIPSVLGVFPDFKIEAPPLTIALLWSYHLFKGLALPAAVLTTALLLGFRRRLGWMLALGLYVVCNFAFIALLLPLISIANALAGATGDANPPSSATLLPPFQSPIAFGWGASLAIGSLMLNQMLFVALLFKRRDFER